MVIDVFAGLGIFLFGMHTMEQALKDAAGRQFKQLIRNSTHTTSKALATGVFATAALQSSSVLSLMTLSFVSASLISMQSGLGLIFGANIGTTATAWIVALFGFKINIESFSLIITGLASLLMLFFSNKIKFVAYMHIFIGFGLLFFGLSFIKEAIDTLGKSFDLTLYSQSSLILFLFIGLLITTIIQSSSATTAIVLSALSSHIINFEQAAMMAIGSNVGTTVTIVLGAIGGVPDKKRLALAHIGFNVFTALVALAIFQPLVMLIDMSVGIKTYPIISLALFHTIFNILGVILLAPWIKKMVPKLNRLFIIKEKPATKYLHKVETKVPDIALEAAQKEIYRFFRSVVKFALLVSNIKPNDLLKNTLDHQEILDRNQDVITFDLNKSYQRNREIEMAIIDFINKLTQENLSNEESLEVERMLRSVEGLAYTTKVFKDIYKNLNDLADDENESVLYNYNHMRKNIVKMFDELLHLIYLEEDIKQLDLIRNHSMEAHDKMRTDITQAFRKYKINKHIVAIMLNVNQAINIASASLCDTTELLLRNVTENQKAKINLPTESES